MVKSKGAASYLQDELAEVEQKLRVLLHSEIPVVAELGRYLLDSGGKRFRPMLTLLFYKLLGGQGPRAAAVELAAGIEMIHLAALVHDDVIDQALMRRNQPALWKQKSLRSAVLEGDFIFSRVIKLLNPYPLSVRSLIVETVEKLLEGELLQESLRWHLPSPQQYDQIIERKTAALIAAACTVGALMGDRTLKAWQRNSIYQAGILLGMAYQMVDDLLDVFGGNRLGKATWMDAKGGWFTGPYILLAHEAPHITEILQRGQLSLADREHLMEQMTRYQIRRRFMTQAKQKIMQAKELLSWTAKSDLKGLLFEIFNAVVERTS